MDKKKIKIQYLLLLLLMFSNNILSHSQGLFTEQLQWIPCDSIIIAHPKEQIREWKGDYYSNLLRTEEFHIKNTRIFILIADGCFGIYCPDIYVFKEKEGLWKLVTSTSAKLKEMITVKVDENEEKIVFETTQGKVIGVLPFNVLNDD